MDRPTPLNSSMPMDRRRFWRRGLVGAGSGIIGVGLGIHLFQKGKARAEMCDRLLDEALPPLTTQSLKHLQSLPGRGRDEVKRYFHEKCLNVGGFVSHICSDSFHDMLGRCHTEEDRNNLLLTAFISDIASETEIYNQIEVIAEDLGKELDFEWDEYCNSLSLKWNAYINDYNGRPSANMFDVDKLNSMIHVGLEDAIRRAQPVASTPGPGETINSVGKAAIMLLPIVRIGVPLGGVTGVAAITVPLFLILAAGPVWDYIVGRLEERRGDYQLAISSRIALLGNHVGAEFEREMRQRLADLHDWQENSLRQAAGKIALQKIGWF